MDKSAGILSSRMRVVKSRLLGIILLGFLWQARANLLFYEGFGYPAGEELGEASSSASWCNDKNQFTIVSGSLYYPGIVPPKGNRLNVKATMPSLDSVRNINNVWLRQSGGTLYVSLIMRLHSFDEIGGTGTGTSLLTVSDKFNNTELFGINLLKTETVRLGILKYPSSGRSVSSSVFFTSGNGANLMVDGSTTYLIVAKYEWVKGASNDVVTLWVDPSYLGYREDAGNRVSTRAGRDGARGAGRLTLSRGCNVNIDELRIGTTWADVTPTLKPPRHWLVVAGVLAVGLVAASFWITRLRHNVRERSAALQKQILERERAEHQRQMEQERARIAHDLHDELGGDITEISMLATRAHGGAGDGEEKRHCLLQLTDKTHQMVAKLEEIVWATDPQHDSLEALVSYLSFYADRFLGLANIKLTLDTSEDAAGVVVEARVRHQLFLVFKEALANVVRHSQSSEVRLKVRVKDRRLEVVVTDNGRGLQGPDPAGGAHEGIGNMRRRMEKLGGQFAIIGLKDQGTTVKLSVPLDL